MTLLFDRREDLEDNPGAHALIVGISSYPYLRGGTEPRTAYDFGFGQLTSPAISAFRFGQWLSERAKPPVPLATCRMMLAPSERELSAEPDLADAVNPCTLDHFLRAVTEWRADANSHPDNVTFLYLSGHGIERSNVGQLFLLADFGNGIGPVLRNSVDVNSIFNGMMPSQRNHRIARTQLYFLDTGRVRPRQLREFELTNATPVFDSELGAVDDRTAVMFYAAASQSDAYAIPGEQTLFNKALLQCLDGLAGHQVDVAGESRWVVTVSSLISTLDEQVQRLGRDFGVKTRVIIGGTIRDTVIHYLDRIPTVDVILQVHPPQAAPFATITILDSEFQPVKSWEPLTAAEVSTSLPAGLYTVRIDIAPGQADFKSQQTIAYILPPYRRLDIKVDE